MKKDSLFLKNMKKKVTIQVEKQPGEKNFSCYMVDDMPGFGLSGYGKTARDAMRDICNSRDETKELFEQEGKQFPDLEFEYKFDMGALFDYFSYLNIAGVAKRAGINASLMRQYAAGVHEPSPKRRGVIEQTLLNIASEIQSVVRQND